MDILPNPKVRIQYLIDEMTEYGKFNTAIYFTVEQYNALTQESLDALIQEHINNWKTFIEVQRNQVAQEPTVEELLAQKEELLSQVQVIEEQINII